MKEPNNTLAIDVLISLILVVNYIFQHGEQGIIGIGLITSLTIPLLPIILLVTVIFSRTRIGKLWGSRTAFILKIIFAVILSYIVWVCPTISVWPGTSTDLLCQKFSLTFGFLTVVHIVAYTSALLTQMVAKIQRSWVISNTTSVSPMVLMSAIILLAIGGLTSGYFLERHTLRKNGLVYAPITVLSTPVAPTPLEQFRAGSFVFRSPKGTIITGSSTYEVKLTNNAELTISKSMTPTDATSMIQTLHNHDQEKAILALADYTIFSPFAFTRLVYANPSTSADPIIRTALTSLRSTELGISPQPFEAHNIHGFIGSTTKDDQTIVWVYTNSEKILWVFTFRHSSRDQIHFLLSNIHPTEASEVNVFTYKTREPM